VRIRTPTFPLRATFPAFLIPVHQVSGTPTGNPRAPQAPVESGIAFAFLPSTCWKETGSTGGLTPARRADVYRRGPDLARESGENTMLAVRTILHPNDFSERSTLAFRLACSLARDYRARLIVLHVAGPSSPLAREGIEAIPPALDRESLRRKLHQIQPRCGTVRVEHRLVEGDPAAEILRAARDTDSDVIVLGTYGRTWLAPRLMGSVAEQVMRQASCPVLLVRAPFHPAQSEAPARVASGEWRVASGE
jgi:nucleotide-binding universal stress UspA family protein